MQTPLPYVHLVSTWRHSRDKCSQTSLIFPHFFASVYYTEHKQKNMGEAGEQG